MNRLQLAGSWDPFLSRPVVEIWS